MNTEEKIKEVVDIISQKNEDVDKFINILEENGFQAVLGDNLSSGLKNYGLAYKQIDGFYIFVYGVNYNEQTKLYNKFDIADIDSESFDRVYDFINYENVAAHCDVSLDTLLKDNFQVKIFYLVNYYGVDSILGGQVETTKCRYLDKII